VLVLLLLGNIGATTAIMYLYNLTDANPTNGYSSDYMNLVYAKPYCRVAPFLIGIATAWKLKEWDRSRPISQATRWILYAIAAGTMGSLVFLCHVHEGTPWSMFESIAYSAAGRVAWGIGIACLMYSCFTAQQSFLNRFFSWSVFGPLARLTFCAYLMHPIILFTYYLNRDHLLHYSNSDLVFWFVGGATISYVVALFVSLLVEKPAMNLEKLIFPQRRPRPKLTPGDDLVADAQQSLVQASVMIHASAAGNN